MIIELTKEQYVAIVKYRAAYFLDFHDKLLGARITELSVQASRSALGDLEYRAYMNTKTLSIMSLIKIYSALAGFVLEGEDIKEIPDELRGLDI